MAEDMYTYTSLAPYEGHRISHHKLSQVYRPFSNGSPWPVVAPVMRLANAGVWRGDGENLLIFSQPVDIVHIL